MATVFGLARQSGATADQTLFIALAPIGDITKTMVNSGIGERNMEKMSRPNKRSRCIIVSFVTRRMSDTKNSANAAASIASERNPPAISFE
jgi:hypothetical protein